jgi:hypothetical protein
MLWAFPHASTLRSRGDDMNCKPNDLAFLICSDFPENLGAIVRVKERCPAPGEPYWYVEVTGERLLFGQLSTGEIVTTADTTEQPICPDSALRPIRPGPDAGAVQTTSPIHEGAACW